MFIISCNMDNGSSSASLLWHALKKYISLNVENAKFTATEKLTVLFAAVAFYLVAVVLLIVVLVFVSMAICDVLSRYMPMYYVYLLLAAFYIVSLLIVYALRKVLFLNPIARFFSKLMLNPPKDNNEKL